MVKDFSFMYAGRPYTVTSETEESSKVKWWLIADGEKMLLCDVTPGETQASLMGAATRYLRAHHKADPHRLGISPSA